MGVTSLDLSAADRLPSVTVARHRFAGWAFLAVVPVLVCASPLDAAPLQLPSCRFTVDLPGNLTFHEMSAPMEGGGVIWWYEAQSKSRSGVFRHECLCVKDMNVGRLEETDARARLREFVSANGLSNPIFTTLSFDPGIAMELRAQKSIQGVPATYVNRVYLTDDCFASAVAGAASESFPPAGLTKFFASIVLSESAPAGLPNSEWLPFQRAPTGALRSLDVSSLKESRSLLDYVQRFDTSVGGGVVISHNTVDCGDGSVRTRRTANYDRMGVQLFAIEYEPDESPFLPAPNDQAMAALRPLLCEMGLPRSPEAIRSRLKRTTPPKRPTH